MLNVNLFNNSVIFEMDKQQTSVFSEYQPMDNCSVNSKQLQYWLKQISSPGPSPKFGFQWTFMSNASSRYEPEEISFARNQTFQSIDHDKENKINIANQAKQAKNKSYVNAMIALQKKVKTLEDENSFMKKSLGRLSEERNRSISDSVAVEEQLRAKLQILQPKTKKIDDLIEQNKRLREGKDQKSRKVKVLQKKCQQLKKSFDETDRKLRQSQQNRQILTKQLQKAHINTNKLSEEVKRLSEKNRQLQDMKEKSTITILEKYNKSVELTQEYQKENGRLKKQISALKKAHLEEVKKIQDNHKNQVHKCRVDFEKLKQNYDIMGSIIEEKKKEAEYFKDAYEKKDLQYIELAKSQIKIQKYISESRTIQIPQTLNQVKKEENGSFAGIQSDNQNQFNNIEIPIPAQTKSVGKPSKKKVRKSIESSSQKMEISRNSQSRVVKQKLKQKTKKENVNQFQAESGEEMKESCIKDKDNKERSFDGQNKSLKSHQVKKSQRKKSKSFEEKSYVVQSDGGPRAVGHHKITFEGQEGRSFDHEQHKVVDSYLYSAHNPLPFSSIRTPQYINHPPMEINQFQHRNTCCQSVNEALFMELQNELLEHYDEIEQLTLMSGNLSHAERAECEGRKKQLNEQLAAKNKRYCELKALL